jgi:hypothetical protein
LGVRVPIKAVEGGLWIGLIKPCEPIPKDAKICECKLYKRDNRWFIDVVVQKDIPCKFNRKLAGFQYYKLTQYIKYKTALVGIKVIQVSEARTSQYCRKCYQKGARKIQGLFTCAKCGEENADRNAAFNIAYRALGYISKVGVTVNMPKLKLRTVASVDRNAMMTKEATYFNR